MDLVFFFSRFQPSILDLLEVKFFISLQFLSMSLSQSHDLSHGFNRLTWVDSGYFLGYFFSN
jgi:hypothetical protein